MDKESTSGSVFGYKAFNEDMTCRGFQYEVGKEFEAEGEIALCENGIHFCRKLASVYDYYPMDHKTIVCKVEATGDVLDDNDGKSVTSRIRILFQLPPDGVLANTGYCNTGYCNTGDYNPGNWNTGNWNTGDYNPGYFNTTTPEMVNVFNKPCRVNEWEHANKPDFLFFSTTEWVQFKDMSEAERVEHPNAEGSGGYLKALDYQEAFQASYNAASDEEKALLWELPNFDPDVFFEISGIRVEKEENNG